MASHLQGGRINISLLREAARRDLLECLEKCNGTKAIVWDDQLTGPFGLIAEYALLKEHEVVRMFPLRPGRLPPAANCQNIIFLTRAKHRLMECIADNVRNEDTGGDRKEFHIFFVPRKSLLCEKRLKDLGVYGTFATVDEYSLDLFPFDADLVSLEIETSFRECHLEQDYTSLYRVAKALMTVEAVYGEIPSICGKGKCAKHVADMLVRMRREVNCSSEGGNVGVITLPHVDSMLLIDRLVDPITPLLTQLTYEGLIDELYTIQNCSVKLPAEKFSTNQPPGEAPPLPTERKEFVLNSSDELFASLRDKNFNAVGPTLSKKAKMLSAQFEERKEAKTVGEMKQFVSKLPHIQAMKQSLGTHTTIAEMIKDCVSTEEFMEQLQIEQEFVNGFETDKVNTYIEDCIGREEPLNKILRLVCLQSLVNNGLKPKVMEHYKREIVQTYGYEYLVSLHNLEKCGLLLEGQGQRTFPTVRKTMNLVTEDVNEQNPEDISYVYSGYAPLSCRLAQLMGSRQGHGMRNIKDVLDLIPGPVFHVQSSTAASGAHRSTKSVSSSSAGVEDSSVCLVVFIGGVTFAEIAALRFLSQQEDASVEYVICTTKIINGKSWLGTLMESTATGES